MQTPSTLRMPHASTWHPLPFRACKPSARRPSAATCRVLAAEGGREGAKWEQRESRGQYSSERNGRGGRGGRGRGGRGLHAGGQRRGPAGGERAERREEGGRGGGKLPGSQAALFGALDQLREASLQGEQADSRGRAGAQGGRAGAHRLMPGGSSSSSSSSSSRGAQGSGRRLKDWDGPPEFTVVGYAPPTPPASTLSSPSAPQSLASSSPTSLSPGTGPQPGLAASSPGREGEGARGQPGGALSAGVSLGGEADMADGKALWQARLAEVGWGGEEDEEGEEDGEMGEEEEGEMEEEEEEWEKEGEEEEGLAVIPALGAWFSGGQGSAEEGEEQATLRRWYTDAGALPSAYWGPLNVAVLPGRGRGLVLQLDAVPGDLLLVSPPLAMIEYMSGGAGGQGGQGEEDAPENEELADHLADSVQLSPAQDHWLEAVMWPGGPDPAACPPVPRAKDIAKVHQGSGSVGHNTLMTRPQLYRLVNANCQGDAFKDIAASSLRGEEAPGWLGLWPTPALINHSCAPNAQSLVIGERLLVRATEELAGGEEVSLSYLGQGLKLPLAQRRAELRDKWAFTCTCQRCRAEERAAGPGSALGDLIQATHQRCQELSSSLEQAIEQQDGRKVVEIRAALEALREEFEGAMRAAKVSSKARRWLQASLYDLYDCLSIAADELSGSDDGRRGAAGSGLDTESLAVCVRILESIGRGSDAQAYLAAEYMVRAGVRFGPQHEEAKQSKRLCEQAFTARYGPVSPALMDSLVAARLDADIDEA